MASYPKIWTSLLYADWFVQLPLQAKGLYLWLILEAKNQSDSGVIVCRNISELSNRVGAFRSTVEKILRNFEKSGKIILKNEHGGPLIIELRNYLKYQQLREHKHLIENPISGVKSHVINQNKIEYKEIIVDGFKRIQRLCPKCHKPATAFVDGVCFACKGWSSPPKPGDQLLQN
jgi:hypothetical protein